MKLLGLLTLTLLLAANTSYSFELFGGISGGGGYVVACYKDGEITSVELLDLYEGRIQGLEYEEVESLEGGIEKLASKIHKTKDFQFTGPKLVQELKRAQQSILFIPEGTELMPTNDALPVFKPKICQFEQVANYYNDSLIWVDEKLYSKLDARNRLALLVHEVIYSREREMGVKDSRYSRRLTALAMSTQDPFVQSLPDKKSFFACSTEDATTYFHAYSEDSDDSRFELHFYWVNGHKTYSSKTITLKMPYLEGKVEEGYDFSDEGYLYSLIDNHEFIKIDFIDGRKFLSWKGYDPGDDFKNKEIKCYQRTLL